MSTQTPLIGKLCPEGPMGRDCHCCGQPPGEDRTKRRRTVKRAEKQAWRRKLREDKDL